MIPNINLSSERNEIMNILVGHRTSECTWNRDSFPISTLEMHKLNKNR